MLISALLCDRCRDSRHVQADIDDDRELLQSAIKHGWHVQHTAKDHTYGRAVCPPCRMAGYGKDWA